MQLLGRTLPRALVTMATLAVCAAASLSPRLGRAIVVERIVAVVGDRPILLSDLKTRARPFLVQIAQSTHSTTERAAAETNTLREVLQRMVDERLEESAADKAKIQITSEEIDGAIANVAAQNKLTSKELLATIAQKGISEQEYRDELKRQLLEGKLVQLRLRGRVRITEEDARSTYARFVREVAAENPVDLRLLALRIDPTTGPRAAEVRQTLATELAERARRGEDFCKLVAQYSDDDETKATCGSRGPQPLKALLPDLQDTVKSMKAGEIAGPIRIADQAVVILQMLGHASVPPYENVRDAMYQRATNEALERQKKAWLNELRRASYIDVRY